MQPSLLLAGAMPALLGQRVSDPRWLGVFLGAAIAAHLANMNLPSTHVYRASCAASIPGTMGMQTAWGCKQ